MVMYLNIGLDILQNQYENNAIWIINLIMIPIGLVSLPDLAVVVLSLLNRLVILSYRYDPLLAVACL